MKSSTTNPDQTEIWTILRLITWGADYFKRKGVDSPRLTMELLIGHVLDLKRFDLYMQFDRPLTEAELAQLRDMVRRRAAREPLQYIIGQTEFHGRIFLVDRSVLIPRPETELLVEEALRRSSSLRALDVGTGSGCIGLTIALERSDTEVICIDNSAEAVALASENAQRLGARNARVEQVDFFDDEAMRQLGSFDLVVSNPPYIPPSELPTLEPEVREWEPRLALTDERDGLSFYRRFLHLAPRLLRERGSLFLELGYDQGKTVSRMFREGGFEVDLLTDLDKVERILWGVWKGGR